MIRKAMGVGAFFGIVPPGWFILRRVARAGERHHAVAVVTRHATGIGSMVGTVIILIVVAAVAVSAAVLACALHRNRGRQRKPGLEAIPARAVSGSGPRLVLLPGGRNPAAEMAPYPLRRAQGAGRPACGPGPARTRDTTRNR